MTNNPAPWEELLQQADEKYQSRDWAAARTLYEAVLQENPQAAVAYSRLGAILAQQGELDAAERNLQIALDIDPTYAPALSNLGNVNYARGQYEAALKLYQQALESEPDHSRYLENMHAAYRKLGRYSEAVTMLKRARRAQRSEARQQGKQEFRRLTSRLGCMSTLVLCVLSTCAVYFFCW